MEKMEYSEISEPEEETLDSPEDMKRKREHLQSALLSMEHNFAVTKQMLFKEKHQFYEKKLKELKDPAKKSAELSAKIRDHEKDISSRKKYIISMKEHKLKHASTWFKAENLAVEQTAANKKKLEKQRLMDKLEGKLFELRDNFKKSPKTKFAFPIAKKKRRNSVAENFTAPSIVYHLPDSEIDIDLHAFRKIAKASGRKRMPSQNTAKNTENVITLECSGIDML
ncbi:unnamed protein product [Oikopleura dioica]|uniref:Uncharacterized protein n=1 Tax=Oikopleura dioica TaxID=34765 RepID=E4YAR3_OIKDI|nr:unnamed protein product [Oikopleura dioica]